jgi:hypothetical protein
VGVLLVYWPVLWCCCLPQAKVRDVDNMMATLTQMEDDITDAPGMFY